MLTASICGRLRRSLRMFGVQFNKMPIIFQKKKKCGRLRRSLRIFGVKFNKILIHIHTHRHVIHTSSFGAKLHKENTRF
jgi:hypothetical protein